MISNPDINIFVVPYTNSLFLSAVKDTVFGKGIFRKEAIFSTLATKKNVRKLSPILRGKIAVYAFELYACRCGGPSTHTQLAKIFATHRKEYNSTFA